MLHSIASKSTDIFRLSAVSNPRHYYNSKLFLLYKDIIAMIFFSILIKAQFHQLNQSQGMFPHWIGLLILLLFSTPTT